MRILCQLPTIELRHLYCGTLPGADERRSGVAESMNKRIIADT
ncbi:MAG: hypothetical protein Q7J46_00360 [Pseudomonas sp.]|nr:hypothetical protein [Pseudomonas sp.]